MKVLIADDSAEIRKRLKNFLSSYIEIDKVYETESVKQTNNTLNFLKPEIVLLDFQMNDGNALDVLKSITSKEYSPVIIIFTNFHYAEYKVQCLRAGAHYFFDKSEFVQLKNVINSIISRSLSTDI